MEFYCDLLPCTPMHSRVMHFVVWVCVYVYVYIYMWPKNWLFEVLLLENLLLVQSSARSLSLTTKKRSSLHQVICSEKEIWRHSTNRMGKGFPENYCIIISYALSTCNAATCTCNAIATAWSAHLHVQYCYRYSLCQ